MAARRRNPTAAKRRKKDAEQGQDTQCKKLEPEVLPDARPFGTLSVMPLEILFNIMSASRLDVPTLASCRCVCRAAKSVVDTGILEYKWLASHHLNVIHAMINADARHPTCAAVCATLRLEQCSFCSRKIRYRPHAAGPLMSACLYLPTAELLCTTCYSNRSGDLIPYCETHLQKHLSDVRKDLGKRGEDQAAVDWSRAHLVPSAQGLLQTSGVNGRVYHQRGWLRPVLYDARAVEQVFGLKLERSLGGTYVSLGCGCNWWSHMVDESLEMRRIMLPLVRSEKRGPLIASLHSHYDMPYLEVMRLPRYGTLLRESSTEETPEPELESEAM